MNAAPHATRPRNHGLCTSAPTSRRNWPVVLREVTGFSIGDQVQQLMQSFTPLKRNSGLNGCSNQPMFKTYLYRRRLRAALLELGIDTEQLNPGFREEMLATGLREGLTPEEVALSVLTVVYPSLSLMDRLSSIHVERKWRSSLQVGHGNEERTQSVALTLARTPMYLER